MRRRKVVGGARLSDLHNLTTLALEPLSEDLSDPVASGFDSSPALISCCGIHIHYQHGGRH